MTAKVTWPMERTGQCTPNTGTKQLAMSKRDISLFPWVHISFGCGMDQVISQNDQLTS